MKSFPKRRLWTPQLQVMHSCIRLAFSSFLAEAYLELLPAWGQELQVSRQEQSAERSPDLAHLESLATIARTNTLQTPQAAKLGQKR